MDDAIRTLFIIICAAMLILLGGTIYEHEVIVPQCIEEGYEIYLDGEEVDADKINFDQYQVSIDVEKECIYLTHSQRNGRSIIPMFIPMGW